MAKTLDELREIGDDAFDGEVVDEDETEEYSDGEEEEETGDGSGDEASDDGNDNDDDVSPRFACYGRSHRVPWPQKPYL